MTRYENDPNKKTRTGFTLIELLVSVAITLTLSSVVYQMYRTCLQMYSVSNNQLAALQAYRSSTDRIELGLSNIIYKANYINDTRHSVKPDLKPVHMGLFSIRFESHRMGFYASMKPGKVDRIMYYFNPGEPDGMQDNGIDDDEDDFSLTHLYLMYDDRGSLMVDHRLDEDIVWSENFASLKPLPPPMAYYLQDGAGPNGWDKAWDPKEQWDPVTQSMESYGNGTYPWDVGDIMCEDLRNIRFRYAYSDPTQSGSAADAFQYADTWPAKSDGDGNYEVGIEDPGSWISDETGYTYGDTGILMDNSFIDVPGGNWDQRKGLSFLTLPQAVTTEFHFHSSDFDQRMSRTFFLYASTWNEYLDKATHN